jgi:hypothetical protein
MCLCVWINDIHKASKVAKRKYQLMYHMIVTSITIFFFTTRKKENSGSQLVTIDVEPLPLPCLPAVMPAVQTVAVCVFSFLTFSCFNKTIET